MAQRIRYNEIAPDGLKIMMNMEKYTSTTTIDKNLRELIKIRVSQINGCAFCLDMHTADIRKMGETDQRISCVSAWEECEFYTEAEKVALELAEHVTLISTERVSDELYQRVRGHYDEKQYVDLILIINQINNWNRISIAMGNTAVKK
ncbi:carboxymuconolactone decarboxylase family protein [Paenibacillus endoradicis]|uniref:carboxymuconolactone decarboxylase family protein n=1 Tax=Paenibacillus endoradicis TaxID=2972487 RepID=UPI0021596C84|nr:carboxymuconolactone decarboxylase family protein [Paenibacillus endoradicis]MCR8659899.1 carboxymuconolactone decarboxylase family protein [Paenibacillus endoradicis]